MNKSIMTWMKKYIIYIALVLIATTCIFCWQCKKVELYMFECLECDTNCTSENATWGFLILSLPFVLFLQYLIDHNENVRQNRIIYLSPVVTLAPEKKSSIGTY